MAGPCVVTRSVVAVVLVFSLQCLLPCHSMGRADEGQDGFASLGYANSVPAIQLLQETLGVDMQKSHTLGNGPDLPPSPFRVHPCRRLGTGGMSNGRRVLTFRRRDCNGGMPRGLCVGFIARAMECGKARDWEVILPGKAKNGLEGPGVVWDNVAPCSKADVVVNYLCLRSKKRSGGKASIHRCQELARKEPKHVLSPAIATRISKLKAEHKAKNVTTPIVVPDAMTYNEVLVRKCKFGGVPEGKCMAAPPRLSDKCGDDTDWDVVVPGESELGPMIRYKIRRRQPLTKCGDAVKTLPGADFACFNQTVDQYTRNSRRGWERPQRLFTCHHEGVYGRKRSRMHMFTEGECGGDLPVGLCVASLRRASECGRAEDWIALAPGERYKDAVGPAVSWWNLHPCSKSQRTRITVDYYCISNKFPNRCPGKRNAGPGRNARPACSGHGTCFQDRKCLCSPGWSGRACNRQVVKCPNGCNGHGKCKSGRCECFPGWKGAACGEDASWDCDSDCNGHGSCQGVVCQCFDGYGGPNCGEVWCAPNNCTEHGKCVAGECKCDMGWAGSDCSVDLSLPCPKDCAGNGFCSDGICECSRGYAGDDCSEVWCPPSNCTMGNGNCVKGLCECKDGWFGTHCDKTEKPTCENNCSQRGDCSSNGTCICMKGFVGLDCSIPIRQECLAPCMHGGVCENGVCDCPTGYDGAFCQVSNCSAIGGCHEPNGVCVAGRCVCRSGFGGKNCQNKICKNDCSDNGVCVNGVCICAKPYAGDDCSSLDLVPCRDNCNSKGVCVDDQCVCQAGYRGSACQHKERCPMGCAGHGFCNQASCICEDGWGGGDCSVEQHCPSGCMGHGRCVLGRCFCDPGWAMHDCSARSPCPNGCNNRGECRKGLCRCDKGWRGPDCAISLSFPNKHARGADHPQFVARDPNQKFVPDGTVQEWPLRPEDDNKKVQTSTGTAEEKKNAMPPRENDNHNGVTLHWQDGWNDGGADAERSLQPHLPTVEEKEQLLEQQKKIRAQLAQLQGELAKQEREAPAPQVMPVGIGNIPAVELLEEDSSVEADYGSFQRDLPGGPMSKPSTPTIPNINSKQQIASDASKISSDNSRQKECDHRAMVKYTKSVWLVAIIALMLGCFGGYALKAHFETHKRTEEWLMYESKIDEIRRRSVGGVGGIVAATGSLNALPEGNDEVADDTSKLI